MKTLCRNAARCAWLPALILALGALAGCRQKVSYEVPEPTAKEKVEAPLTTVPASIEAPAEQKTFCFVAQGEVPNFQNAVAVAEISPMEKQTVLARIQGLTLGKEYSLKWEGYDAKGVLIASSNKTIVATVTEGWDSFSFKPNPTNYTMGKWKWVYTVSDLGRFETHVNVLQLTQPEEKRLADYEKARENVLMAFSHYWFGDAGAFDTIISYEKQEDPEVRALKEKFSTLQRRAAELADYLERTRPLSNDLSLPMDYKRLAAEMELEKVKKELSELRFKVPFEPPQQQTVPDQFLGYLQIMGVEWGLSGDGQVSQADKLNGITWRGSASVSFSLFRFYREGKGWEDWVDSASGGSIASFFGRMLGSVPEQLRNRLILEFSILQRDGNWFVTAASGDRFVNGKLISSSGDWKSSKPFPAFARAIRNGEKSFTRESFRELGEFARRNPDPQDRSAQDTMTLMRGRQLF